MRVIRIVCSLAALAASLAFAALTAVGAAQLAPMMFTASPDNATVEATVTRPGFARPLPASEVPSLQKGDRVEIRFPSSEQDPGPATHRFHALVAYIGLTTRFIPANDPGYSLFPDRKHNDGRTIDFTYDPSLGTPVVFLFPEDRQTRLVDGVREYVLDNPAQFLGSAMIASTSDDRQVWFADFMQGLGNGNIGNSPASESQIEGLARSFGVTDTASVDTCYTQYSPDKAAIGRCVVGLVQTANPSAFFSASNLGTIPTSFAPDTASIYVAAVGVLASLWNQIRKPKQNYEFIPATLKYVPASLPGEPAHQEIAPAAPARWNPPSGVSSVLFFTIGRSSYDASTDPQPAIADTDPSHQALCLDGPPTALPLKLNRASAYVRNGRLTVFRADSDAVVKTIPVPAGALTDPVLGGDDVAPGAYDVALTAPFGFGQLASSRKTRVVRPAPQHWETRAPLKIVAGTPRTTVEFTSLFAPCVSAAELVDSNLTSTSATVRHLASDRVELDFNTSQLTPGDATMDVHQGPSIEDRVRYFAALPYPVTSAPPVVYDGDDQITLVGQRLQLIKALTLESASGKTLLELPRESPAPAYRADGTTARFVAPSGTIDVAAQPAVVKLTYYDGRRPNEIPVRVALARPTIAAVSVDAPPSAGSLSPLEPGIVLSSGSAAITVTGPPQGIYPEKAVLRLREASVARTFGDAASITLPTIREADGRTLRAALDLSTQIGDALNGRLQIQVYDPQRQVGSDWVALQQRFVPSASIDEIDCPGDPSQPCKLLGRNLTRIEQISDGADASVPTPCPGQLAATQSCVLVKDYPQYIVTMFGSDPAPTARVDGSIVKREAAPQ